MNKLNESRFYLSPSLKKYLGKNIANRIAKELLEFEGKETGKDITLIDVDGETFTYSSAKVIDKAYRNNMSNLSNDEGDKVDINKRFFNSEVEKILNSKTRSTIRIGKLVNSLFPNKFSDSEIEKFVNIIRAKNSTEYNFRIVSGEEILNYYDSENCADPDNSTYQLGTLASSCMMDKPRSIFEIYVKNPETCKMLVMLNNRDELVARALLWKVDCTDMENGEKFKAEFLDRVYFQKEWMSNSMIDYATENGFIIKYYNSGISHNDCKVVLNGEDRYLRMTVSIRKIFYKRFPYLDTLKYFDVKNGLLANYKVSGFTLCDLGGSYSSSSGLSNNFRNSIRRFK